MKQLGDRLDKLGSRVTTARVGLEGNKEANVELDKLDLKLIRLGKKVANPSIDVEGKAKALADIAAVDLAMDRLNKKFVVAVRPSLGARLGRSLVSARGFGSLVSGLFGGGSGAGGAAAAAAPAAGGFGDFLGSPAGIGTAGGIAALVAPTIAALVDAISGFGVGALGAGAGGLLVQKFNPAVLKPGLSNISRTFSSVAQSIGPSVGLMVAQFGKFVQGTAPQLAKFFASTLPFMRAFFTVIEQAARVFLPALTQVMQQMVSSGALKIMTQGFVFLAQGLADFIKELGPGFKAGAEAFRAIALGIKGVLIGLGDTFGWLGKFAGIEYRVIRDWWDKLRHDTADIFDGIRHDLAAWGHNVVAFFNTLSRAAGAAWNILWNGIKQATRDGIGLVTGWFGGMPGKILHALWGLGHTLGSFAASALNEMWDGFKRVGGSILHWIDGFAHGVLGIFKKVWGWLSPSTVMFEAGRDLMLGLEKGLKAHAHRATRAVSGIGAGVSGGVTSWITDALKLSGEPLSWLPALQRLVSLESGGNPRAVNPTAVLGEHASGLWQMLPSTFAGYGGRGSIFNPITEGVAALKYISAVYGSPFRIPNLFSGNYQGYALGGMITEPVFGVGLRSGRGYGFGENGPELVTPARGRYGGGVTIVQHIAVGHGTHPVAAAQEIVKLINMGAKSGVKIRASAISQSG